MKTAKVFDGEKLIDVQEGTTFEVKGSPKWNMGASVIFSVRSDVLVHTIVEKCDMVKTTFLVTSIESKDEFSKIEVEAEDTDFEVLSEEDNVLEDKPKFTKTKFTKKDLVEFIESNSIDIDTSMTKANIVSALTDLNYM